jgi:hypothetical protein
MGDWEDWHNDDAQADRDYWNTKYEHAPECETHGVEMVWSEDVEDYECPECVADWSAYTYV